MRAFLLTFLAFVLTVPVPVLAAPPERLEQLLQVARAKLDTGDITGAIAQYDQALLLDPHSADACFQRAICHALQEHWLPAHTDFHTTLRLEPKKFYAAFLSWLAQVRLGKEPEAQAELRAALEKRSDPKPGDWYEKLGAFLLGTLAEAELLRAAETSDPQTTREQLCEAWYFAGVQRLRAGQREAAAQAYRQCLATEQQVFAEYRLARAELARLEGKKP